MFKKKKEPEIPADIWGRAPMELYEKLGTPIQRAENKFKLTVDGKLIHDYFVVFSSAKPDIRGHRDLLQSAEWINYGTKLYRINTVYVSNEIEKLVAEEFDIKIGEDFFVSNTFFDPRFPHFSF